jgi:hypothetical protein
MDECLSQGSAEPTRNRPQDEGQQGQVPQPAGFEAIPRDRNASAGTGQPVWCLAIKHPSRAFSWRKWHRVIAAFVHDPTKAGPLLIELRNKNAGEPDVKLAASHFF